MFWIKIKLYYKMDQFLGKWKLIKNNRFSDFLIFTQTSWLIRSLALTSNIEVNISKNACGYSKSVSSLFYNSHEDIILDKKYSQSGSLKKKYYIQDKCVNSDIIGEIVNWNEKIFIESNKLIIEYLWLEDNMLKTATQDFIKI